MPLVLHARDLRPSAARGATMRSAMSSQQQPGSASGEWSLVPAVEAARAAALHRANVAAWNQAAQRYRESLDATIAFLRAGNSSLHPVERANLARLGPLGSWCRDAVHLQCASGRDTLSLLREGVQRVAGVDISPVHVENARRLSETLGLDAESEWHCCDVLDTPHQLDGRFDLVYTGMGGLCWIHDIGGWASVAARLLRPGGVLHVFDNHPFLWMWDDTTDTLQVHPAVSYFDQAGISTGWTSDYLPGLEGEPKHERSWTFADVVGAVLGAGFELLHLGEHREDYGCEFFPNLPPEQRARIPITFSLLARRG